MAKRKTSLCRTDVRNLTVVPEAEIKKIAKAIEKNKSAKKVQTTEKEPQVQQMYKIIDEIENRVDILTSIMGSIASGSTQTSSRMWGVWRYFVSRIDGLSSKVQLTRQNYV